MRDDLVPLFTLAHFWCLNTVPITLAFGLSLLLPRPLFFFYYF